MQYSIVIPVFRRSDILKKCLISVYKQTLMPFEILVIDNNINKSETDKLNKLINKFKSNKLDIKLLKSPKNSGAIARNIGADIARGEIVAFLDSDVVLDNNYYEILIDYFNRFDDLLAIQGIDKSLIESQKMISKYNLFSKILYKAEQFFEISLLFNKKVPYVSPSLAVAHPNVLNDFEVNSQWISTCAGLFKKELFNNFSFPKQFITYSNNEYLFFSYSIFKKAKGRMIYTNKAKYRDIQTSSGRLDPKSLMYQIQVYDLYIFLKFFDGSLINFYIFLKSRFGHLLLNILRIFRKKRFSLLNLFYTIDSIFYPLRHIDSIRKEDLSFYEKDFPIEKDTNYVPN